mmetsp:Transcript_15716/g.22427  ORF Transcript_15716/g.22427 Transcript_15716/m.22427 type:complete len:117 (+) Transcript_15716:426-776(+)
MTATEAKQRLESRKLANRRSAGIAVGGSRGMGVKSPPTLGQASPDSAETWDDCAEPSSGAPGGACVALGKQMLEEAKAVKPSIKEITEDIVLKQHGLGYSPRGLPRPVRGLLPIVG